MLEIASVDGPIVFAMALGRPFRASLHRRQFIRHEAPGAVTTHLLPAFGRCVEAGGVRCGAGTNMHL